MAEPVVAAEADRDSWCTPEWLTRLLPLVDLDPCSNARSTVIAHRAYSLADGQDGLALPWVDSVFCNPPFSDILPWSQKLAASPDVTAAAFLVNADPSTQWWRVLAQRLPYGLFFHKRIQFTPPFGVKPSTNSKPQVLLMDRAFLLSCKPALLEAGTLWAVQR